MAKVIGFIITTLCVICYWWNIFAICVILSYDLHTPVQLFFRIVGVFFPPLGVLMGFFGA